MYKNLRLFGTSGVRGLTNIEITPSFTLKLAEAYGMLLGNNKTVVVGRDTRFGNETLQSAAMTGLASVGNNVEDCGVLPVGALLHYLVKSGADGGLLISGSHQTSDKTGIIPLLNNGQYAGPDIALRIEHLFFTAASNVERIPAEKIGRIDRSSVITPYLNSLISLIDENVIAEHGFKVLVDPGHGTASILMSSLLKKLGCDVVSINDTPVSIPMAKSEPFEESWKKTSAQTIKNRCDIGVLFDSDADRTLFIDSYGNLINGDYMAALFAKSILDKGDSIVVPVNSSTLMSHVCTRLKVQVIPCGVGQPFIAQAMVSSKAKFGYDKNGKYFFGEVGPWADGHVTVLKLLEIMSKSKMSIDRILNSMPEFFQRNLDIEYALKDRMRIMDKVTPIWNSMDRNQYVKKIEIDGIKRIYDDYSWLLIRPSGNEHLIRITSEAMNMPRAKELLLLGEKIVKRAIKQP